MLSFRSLALSEFSFFTLLFRIVYPQLFELFPLEAYYNSLFPFAPLHHSALCAVPLPPGVMMPNLKYLFLPLSLFLSTLQIPAVSSL